jgi:hypothetical protein
MPWISFEENPIARSCAVVTFPHCRAVTSAARA